MPSRFRTGLMVGSLSLAGALFTLAIASLWVNIVLTRDSARWIMNSAAGTQELQSTQLALDLHAGRIDCSQTRTISQIGPIDSAATGAPSGDWDFVLFVAGQQRVRSWDRHWFVDRWNNWRLGDLGWYESAGGGAISRILSMPLWMPIVLCGIPGALAAFSSMRAARRRARGQCLRCGYRLANAQHVCPECGRSSTPSSPVGTSKRA